jgi:transcriptional regulator with PAS, ATPase and Fis domain
LTDELTRTLVTAAAVDVPRARLDVRDPSGAIQSLWLALDEQVVGSDPAADLTVTEAAVSRRHFGVRLTEQGVRVRDLGSKNGLYVDRTRVLDGYCAVGSVVAFGGCRAELVTTGARQTVPLSRKVRFGEMLGASVAMRALFARLERLARDDQSVLVVGESGTGKELIARGLHAEGNRAGKPFIVFDCAAVSAGLVEAELFGHARGAFTGAIAARDGVFEAAHEGTLLIDEIGDLPFDLQPKLLRVLEQREVRRLGETQVRQVDVRVVAATHRDVRALVKAGTFRQDLYYRLAVSEVRVPPLRERREDIAVIADHLLEELGSGRRLEDMPKGTLELLESYDWPGNVRELRNVVARLLLFPEEGLNILASPGPLAKELEDDVAVRLERLDLPLRAARELVVASFERRYLKAKVAAAGGNMTLAASSMGISRQYLYRLVEEHGLHSPRADDTSPD